ARPQLKRALKTSYRFFLESKGLLGASSIDQRFSIVAAFRFGLRIEFVVCLIELLDGPLVVLLVKQIDARAQKIFGITGSFHIRRQIDVPTLAGIGQRVVGPAAFTEGKVDCERIALACFNLSRP